MSRRIQFFLFFFCLLFCRILNYLVCVQSFKSINSISLYRKKYGGVNFTIILRQRLQGQNTSIGIGLIELTEPSDTLNYKPLFKYCISKSILHVFLFFIFVLNKIFFSKTWAVFYIFLSDLWWHSLFQHEKCCASGALCMKL